MKKNYLTELDKNILQVCLSWIKERAQLNAGKLLSFAKRNGADAGVLLLLAGIVWVLIPHPPKELYLEGEKVSLLQPLSLIRGVDIYKFFSSSFYGLVIFPYTALGYLKLWGEFGSHSYISFLVLGDFIDQARLFNLGLSWGLLVLLYWLISKNSSKWMGLLAVLLLSVQPFFQKSVGLAIPSILFLILLLISWYWLRHFFLNRTLSSFCFFSLAMGLATATLERGFLIYLFLFPFYLIFMASGEPESFLSTG